jgi:P-type E1-E2 ATPase
MPGPFTDFPRPSASLWEREIAFRIGSLDCRACVRHARATLRRVPGVRRASVHYTSQVALVVYDVRATSETEIAHAMRSAGYRLAPLARTASRFEVCARAVCVVLTVNAFAVGLVFDDERSGAAAAARIALSLTVLALGAAALLRGPAFARGPKPAAALAMTAASLAFVAGLLEVAFCTQLLEPLTAVLGRIGFGAEAWRAAPLGGFEAAAVISTGALVTHGLAEALRTRALRALTQRDRSRAGYARRIDARGEEGWIRCRDLSAGDRIRLLEGDVAPEELILETSARFVEATEEAYGKRVERRDLSLSLRRSPGEVVPQGARLLSGQAVGRVTRRSDHRAALADEEVTRALARLSAADPLDPNRVAASAVSAGAIVWAVFAIAAHAFGALQVTPAAFSAAIAVLAGVSAATFLMATPAAQAIAILRARADGIVIRDARCLDRVAAVDVVCIDPRGTLTNAPRVARLGWLTASPDKSILEATLAIARACSDPRSQAVAAYLASNGVSVSLLPAENRVDREGERAFARFGGRVVELVSSAERGRSVIFFGEPDAPSGFFEIETPVRDTAAAAIAGLASLSIAARIFASSAGAQRVSTHLAVETSGGAADSDNSLAIRNLQHGGARVMLVTDGASDGGGAQLADVAVALAPDSPPGAVPAAVVLTEDRLDVIPKLVNIARDLRARLRENLVMAVAYNAVLTPLAILGYVPPIACAALAFGHAILALGNAARLLRRAEAPSIERAAALAGEVRAATAPCTASASSMLEPIAQAEPAG